MYLSELGAYGLRVFLGTIVQQTTGDQDSPVGRLSKASTAVASRGYAYCPEGTLQLVLQ